MSSGNEIIVSAQPKGQFLEGWISGALKPGQCVQVKAGTEPVGGDFTYEKAAPSSDGDYLPIIVLLPDRLQGKLETDAYVDGDRCFLYVPAPGELLNMLLLDISGTGDDFTIGQKLMVDNATGKLIAFTGTPESVPFICMETVTDPTADHLTLCMRTGN